MQALASNPEYAAAVRLATTRPAPAPKLRLRARPTKPGATGLFVRGLVLGFALGMLARVAFPDRWLRAHVEARGFVAAVIVPAEARALRWLRSR